ncbi:MAG: hypothetical protein E7623_00805 [Ruminococcaceae bacterium]|nr:hypothetical protein [Oscillospiraceae bacterium]
MIEKIYTIPVNEAFDECIERPEYGCPFCRLISKTEANEISAALGAAMMEPDTRIKMNEQGFCGRHLSQMLEGGNKLSLALILESHMAEVYKELEKDKGLGALLHGGAGNGSLKALERREDSCYVCGRINFTFNKFLSNSVLLWETEREFREKLKAQPYICLTHYKQLLEIGQRELKKKSFSDFYADLSKPVLSYFEALREDVTFFTKKFDYRYADEPWGTAKDSVERAVKFLKGDCSQKLK